MPTPLLCPRGHEVAVGESDAGRAGDTRLACPVCGAALVRAPRAGEPPGASEAATLSPPPAAHSAGETITLPPTAPSPEAATLPVAGAGPARVAVPGYEILGKLGEGGMGVVYKAR